MFLAIVSAMFFILGNLASHIKIYLFINFVPDNWMNSIVCENILVVSHVFSRRIIKPAPYIIAII